jgi:Cu(I)/Ag(I) efflux system membrane fusion protein
VAAAQNARDIRRRTRPAPDRSTAVTDSQASELTLTVSEAAVRPIQVWVRTAGALDPSRRTVAAVVPAAEAALVRVGQRARAFSPESRSRMYQARVAAVAPRRDRGVDVQATLLGGSSDAASRFVLEIVTEGGEFLSVPNEAIVETGDRRLVYVPQRDGSYAPREIAAGVQGELFTQVLDGLKPGEQVVTVGSFFIDADHRLKAAP